MDDLKTFYTVASEAVRTTNRGMGVTVHGESFVTSKLPTSQRQSG
jgi:hypothetical protein